MALDATDRAIVRATQAGLPLCREPYHVIAEQLALEPAEVMQRLRRLLEKASSAASAPSRITMLSATAPTG